MCIWHSVLSSITSIHSYLLKHTFTLTHIYRASLSNAIGRCSSEGVVGALLCPAATQQKVLYDVVVLILYVNINTQLGSLQVVYVLS